MASAEFNEHDQSLGVSLVHWRGCEAPGRVAIEGQYCKLEPFDIDQHAAELFTAYSADVSGVMWNYLPRGPYFQLDDYITVCKKFYLGANPLVYAIVDRDRGRAVGQACYMNIDPPNGCIEIGGVTFSPALQKTRAGTEALYLLLDKLFCELGYRRCAWQCNSLNANSRSAASRLGFTFEGIFRQAAFVKGRNRDTAWYSILDSEWLEQREKINRWLEPNNFDKSGKQLISLSNI